MIPLKGENPTKTFSFVTISIIAINILIFLYELNQGSQLKDKITLFGVTPYDITHMSSPLVLVTLCTSLFFHAGFAHIFGNMLYLWVFGNNIEDRLGHARFAFFYLICGIVATLGYIITAPDSKLPLIGASGAVSGVLGAYLLLYPKAKVLVLIPLFFIWRIARIQAIWFLLFWIIIQFLYGTASIASMDASNRGGIAWFAHISGFFAGMLFLTLLLKNKGNDDAAYNS